MPTTTWSGGRRWYLSLLAATAFLVSFGAGTAAAIGVAGVDLSVVLPTDADDRPQFDRASDAVEVVLRNLEDEERTVSLYAVSASPTDEGSFALGGPGSAGWFGLGEHTVTLEPREERAFTAEPRHRAMPEEATHLAVVLEAGTDSTLVTRAARVIELRGEAPSGLPWWLLALAAALLGTTLGAHAWRWYDERRAPSTPSSAAPPAADGDPRVLEPV